MRRGGRMGGSGCGGQVIVEVNRGAACALPSNDRAVCHDFANAPESQMASSSPESKKHGPAMDRRAVIVSVAGAPGLVQHGAIGEGFQIDNGRELYVPSGNTKESYLFRDLW